MNLEMIMNLMRSMIVVWTVWLSIQSHPFGNVSSQIEYIMYNYLQYKIPLWPTPLIISLAKIQLLPLK